MFHVKQAARTGLKGVWQGSSGGLAWIWAAQAAGENRLRCAR